MRLFPAVFVLVALALSGCTPAVTPDPSGTPTASATPTATPSASAEPTAAPVTCDTILTELGFQDLADDGLIEQEFTGDGEVDLRFMIDAGGVACRWGKPSTDIIATIGQAPMSQADWDSKRASLEAEGFTPTDDPAIGFLVQPVAGSGVHGGFLWRDGQLYYVSAPFLLNSIPALQE